MVLIQRPKVMLTYEEKESLRKATEVVREIVDALAYNEEKGFSAFQNGLDAPEAFWELKALFYRIDKDNLIP